MARRSTFGYDRVRIDTPAAPRGLQ